MTISYTLLHNTLEISVDDKLKLSVSTTVECWIQYSVHLRALLVPYWGTCHQLTCSKYFNCRDVNKNWFHTKHKAQPATTPAWHIRPHWELVRALQCPVNDLPAGGHHWELLFSLLCGWEKINKRAQISTDRWRQTSGSIHFEKYLREMTLTLKRWLPQLN